MQGAIQWAQGQRQAGRQGTQCPDITTGDLNGNAGANATRSVTVQCAGFDGNGLPEATASMPAVRAAWRTAPARAINVTGSGSHPHRRCVVVERHRSTSSVADDRRDRRLRRRAAAHATGSIAASPLDCASRTETTPTPAPIAIAARSGVDRPVDPIRSVRCDRDTASSRSRPGCTGIATFFDGSATARAATSRRSCSSRWPARLRLHVLRREPAGLEDRSVAGARHVAVERAATSRPDASRVRRSTSGALRRQLHDAGRRERHASRSVRRRTTSGSRSSIAQVPHGHDPTSAETPARRRRRVDASTATADRSTSAPSPTDAGRRCCAATECDRDRSTAQDADFVEGRLAAATGAGDVVR